MKKHFTPLLAAAVVLSLAACGNRPLSRNDAERILNAGLGFPKFTTTTIKKRFLKEAKGSQGFLCIAGLARGIDRLNDQMPRLEPLRKKGLIQFGKDAIVRERYCRYVYATIELTAQGKTFLASETADTFVVNEFQWLLDRITGIQMAEQNTQARVEYVLAKFPAFTERALPEQETRSAVLARYDDGWRLMR